MKKITNLMVFITVTIITILFSGCSNTTGYEKEIIEVIETKREAIIEKNIKKYMSTIDSTNIEFYNEQKRLINNIVNNNIENYTLELIKMEPVDENTVIVTLNQKHKYNYKDFDFTYEEKYIKTLNGWKDSDINTNIKETNNFIIKYMDNDANLDKIINEAEKGYKEIVERYGREPETKTILKVYSDRELLRQSIDPTIAWEFTGWYELKEALKLYSGREDEYSYAGLISHELTHRITMEDSNNNMPYWFAEGLAMYFANFHENGGDHLEKGWYTKEDFNLPIRDLELMELESLTDSYNIGRYYGVSGIIVKYIDMKYGRDKLYNIIHELGKYEYSENIENQDFDKQNQQKLREVIKNVLEIDLDSLSNDCIIWINETY